jgi:hypothetical protein
MGWLGKSKAVDLPATTAGESMNPRKKIKALYQGGLFSLLDWS